MTEIIRSPLMLKQKLHAHPTRVKKIGFVPTMGALHRGHIELIKKSKFENDVTVVSIYINPTQFNNKEDLANYPAPIESDLKLLENSQVDFLFLPNYQDLYPDDFTMKVKETELSLTYCGNFRPGHFTGMLTVVLKLLNIVSPSTAYFGLKDYQQFALIKKMKEALFLDCEISGVETVRESTGLALSSRNERLSESDKIFAAHIYRVLKSEISIDDKRKELTGLGFEVEYLEPLADRLLIAAWYKGVRLIDNV